LNSIRQLEEKTKRLEADLAALKNASLWAYYLFCLFTFNFEKK
jgi:hypothetical protein